MSMCDHWRSGVQLALASLPAHSLYAQQRLRAAQFGTLCSELHSCGWFMQHSTAVDMCVLPQQQLRLTDYSENCGSAVV